MPTSDHQKLSNSFDILTRLPLTVGGFQTPSSLETPALRCLALGPEFHLRIHSQILLPSVRSHQVGLEAGARTLATT